MTSYAWLWVYAGVALMLAELITPGFILCFFGLAAATVGVLRFVFGDGFDLAWQLAAFSAFSVLYIVLLRRWFRRALIGDRKDSHKIDNERIGRVGRVVAEIAPPLLGRVVIGDSEWNAVADGPVEAGANVKVISQTNLTLKVEKI